MLIINLYDLFFKVNPFLIYVELDYLFYLINPIYMSLFLLIYYLFLINLNFIHLLFT